MAENTLDTLAVEIKYLRADMVEVKRDVKNVNETITAGYVTKDELKACVDAVHERYSPVLKIAYGLMAVMALAVLTALIALVINKGGM
jgi:cell division protein FtsL